MNYTASVLLPYYKLLNKKLENGEVVCDKIKDGTMGNNLVELIAPQIIFDMSKAENRIKFDCRSTPENYIKKEGEWYNSHELKIDKVNDVKIWKECADETGQINSNYGNLVFSKSNFNQFEHVVKTLRDFKYSRQAIIIYTRPSIHLEHNDLGGRDFICTNYQQFFIRDDKLVCVTSMRSNDCIFGTFNDIPWFFDVYNNMYDRLKEVYPELEKGDFIFIPNSWHCYEAHFDILKKIASE